MVWRACRMRRGISCSRSHIILIRSLILSLGIDILVLGRNVVLNLSPPSTAPSTTSPAFGGLHAYQPESPCSVVPHNTLSDGPVAQIFIFFLVQFLGIAKAM